MPSYLPEGYSVQEIYVGVGNSATITLISDRPIERIDREPPDKPKDYQIHLVECEILMFVSFETDLRIVGGNSKPTQIPMEFHKFSDGSFGVDWSVEIEGKTAFLRMIAKGDAADKEAELTRIGESVK